MAQNKDYSITIERTVVTRQTVNISAPGRNQALLGASAKLDDDKWEPVSDAYRPTEVTVAD